MAAVRLFLHLGILAFSVFSVWQNVVLTSHDPFLGHGSYAGRWKFLTFQNQVLQAGFFGVALLCDLLQLCLSDRNRLCSALTRVKDFIFASLAFPIGVFVFAAFWGLHIYDRELVYPAVIDKVIPLWLNHCMHTLNFPIVLIELFACPHQYPSRKNGLTVLAVYGIAYLLWVHWVHYASDLWAYPILGKLNAIGLLAFSGSAVLIVFTFYLVGQWLTRLRWGSESPARKKKKKSK